MGRFEGRAAVVTGAASGIGAAMATLFIEEGGAVVLCDIDDERGSALADSLGDRARYVNVDVSLEGSIDAAIACCDEAFSSFDVLCNNAGNPGSTGSIMQADMAAFDQTVAIHLRGTYLGIRAAARVMAPRGAGSIINTASVAGITANMAGHDYSACKAALIHLTETTANELGEYGVRVNAICPGAIATPIFGKVAGLEGDAAQRTVAFVTTALGDLAPIKRAGQPRDIAEAALWLATESSSYVNGQAIVVDGGLTTGTLWRNSQANYDLLFGALHDVAASHGEV